MTNIEYAESLEQIAAFYRAHPDMKQPYDTLWVNCWEREDFVKTAVMLADGGRVAKSADAPHAVAPRYHAKRVFGGVTVDVHIDRSTVCRMVSPAVYECPDSMLEEAVEYGVQA